MTLPDTDMLYLREDEREWTPFGERVIAIPARFIRLLQGRLIEARKWARKMKAERDRIKRASRVWSRAYFSANRSRDRYKHLYEQQRTRAEQAEEVIAIMAEREDWRRYEQAAGESIQREGE